jgi:RNA recognition motif-containing protein
MTKGVGGVSQQQQLIQHVQESFSVYVSNLPLDITEEELGEHILSSFS